MSAFTALTAPLVAIAPSQAAELTTWRFDPDTRQLEVLVPRGTTPNYFLLAQPARIVLDLPNTVVGNVLEEQSYPGVIRNIRVSQFQPNLTRIVIELSPDAELAPAQVELRQASSPRDSSGRERWLIRPLLAGETPIAATEPVPSTPAPDDIDDSIETSSDSDGTLFEPETLSENIPGENATEGNTTEENATIGADSEDAELIPPPPLEPEAFEIPVEIPPPLPNLDTSAIAATRSPLDGIDEPEANDDVSLPVAIAPTSPATPDDEESTESPPDSSDSGSRLRTRETRITARTPEELRRALEQVLPPGSSVAIVDDESETTVSNSAENEPRASEELSVPEEGLTPEESAIDGNLDNSELANAEPSLNDAENDADDPTETDIANREETDRIAESADVEADAESETEAQTTPEMSETTRVRADRQVDRQADEEAIALPSSFPSPESTLSRGASVAPLDPEALSALPPAVVNDELPVTVNIPAITETDIRPNSQSALEQPSSNSQSSAPQPFPQPSIASEPSAIVRATHSAPSPASASASGTTSGAPSETESVNVIDFGQPISGQSTPSTSTARLPESPPVSPTPSSGLMPVLSPSPSSERELVVAAQPNALIPLGTVVRLRYPRLTPTVLQKGIAWQDVLLLDQTIRDRSGRVLAPEGSQVIGRFEIARQQIRFVTQAIALDGRNISLQAVSGWVPVSAESTAVVIRPNQIVNVRLAENFLP